MQAVEKLRLTAGQWLGFQHRTTGWRMLQSFVGGAFGIFGVGYLMQRWLGDDVSVLPLVAPIGASAVLVFAVPASPLAQPWAIVGGNTISAFCGIFWMKIIPDPAYAAALAVASAIAMMSLARCLHPPGGACALTSVIGGHTVVAAGWSFAFMPVAADSALLVAFGLLYNTAIRGNYPYRTAIYTAAVPAKAGYTIADIESVLEQYDELLDVSSEDLDTLFRQVETRAYRRLHGVIRCEQIMRSDMPAVNSRATLDQANPLFSASGLRALPVVDDDGHVEGLLSVDKLSRAGNDPVLHAMDASPCIAPALTPIDELLPILSGGIYHEALVVNAQGGLLGLITETDLLSALWRGHIAEQIALSKGE